MLSKELLLNKLVQDLLDSFAGVSFHKDSKPEVLTYVWRVVSVALTQ
jgi:hypothetical protein